MGDLDFISGRLSSPSGRLFDGNFDALFRVLYNFIVFCVFFLGGGGGWGGVLVLK